MVTTTAGTCVNVSTVSIPPNNLPPVELIITQSAILDCSGAEIQLLLDTDVVNPQLIYDGPEDIPDDTIDPFITTAGIYAVTISDANGCSATVMYDVESDAEPPIARDTTISYDCNLPLVDRILMVTMTGTIDSVSWTGPDGYTSTDLTPVALVSGDYNIEIFDTNGCTANATATLEIINSGIDLFVNDLTLTCGSPELTLCTEEPPEWISVFEWTDEQGQVLSTERCSSPLTDAGSYTISQIQSGGCQGEFTFMILDIRDQLAAILNADTQILSCGATVTLDALSSALGTQTSIEWSRDGIPDSSQLNASSWEITEAGWYRVTLFDSLSMCTSSDSLLITQDTNIPDFNFNIETGDCGDDRIVLVLGNHTVYQSLTINDMMLSLIHI